MSISNAPRLVQAPDVLLQDLDGEAVLLNLKNGQYYGMDKNSYHMYKTLLACHSTQEAYETLAREYAVDPVQLRADLDLFLAHLLQNGLVVDADEQAG